MTEGNTAYSLLAYRFPSEEGEEVEEILTEERGGRENVRKCKKEKREKNFE